VHVIGKEIVRFHAIIWPAILMALDIPVPKRVFGHGWLLFGGDKLSKSKTVSNVECVDPRILAPRYSADAVRYILLREIPFGSDGNYSTELFLNLINSDLANNYGNLISRTFTMLKKYEGGIVPEITDEEEVDKNLRTSVLELVEETKKHMNSNFDVSKALGSIFDIFSKANKYIEETEPYKLAKDESKKDKLKLVMRNLLESIRIGTVLLSAFLPDCSKKVLDALHVNGADILSLNEFYGLKEGDTVEELGILFPRLDVTKELEELSKIVQ